MATTAGHLSAELLVRFKASGTTHPVADIELPLIVGESDGTVLQLLIDFEGFAQGIREALEQRPTGTLGSRGTMTGSGPSEPA